MAKLNYHKKQSNLFVCRVRWFGRTSYLELQLKVLKLTLKKFSKNSQKAV